ncbi:MAG: arginine--tRNA ligase [Vibrionaceae bacterium]
MNIQTLINDKISSAMQAAGAPNDCPALVRQSAKAQFGEYQANGIMAAAKKLGMAPRTFAEQVIEKLDLSGIATKVEIAGPGFINIFLDSDWLAATARAARQAPRLGITRPAPQTIVVDYSAPNVAKEMHVGHLRSTIIGDAVTRTLEFLGHNVIRANHLGDWGTQFGMLIANLERHEKAGTDISMDLQDIEGFYRESKQLYDEDPQFATTARQYVVKLQSGDAYCLQKWRTLVDITVQQNQQNYDRLNVSLTPKDIMSESMYNPMLAGLVADLKAKGLAQESDGATVVFLDEFKNKEGEPMGVIVQKSDGGFLYTTTDIACAKYRYEKLGAERVLYFIDSRQSQHLMQAWTIVRKAGYVPPGVTLEHHAFGMMLGKDGKPFKTRAGGTIRLADLLDEANVRAAAIIEEKNPTLLDDEKKQIATTIAMGAIKYADLSKHRTTDYVFDWDLMLSFDGNTAPYLQYAYTRIASIFNKAQLDPSTLQGEIVLSEPHEKRLAVQLLQFEEALQTVANDALPHVLCSYLFDLAGLFSSFYENCPILSADAASKESRLQLADLTARTIKTGLSLLGINTLERM